MRKQVAIIVGKIFQQDENQIRMIKFTLHLGNRIIRIEMPIRDVEIEATLPIDLEELVYNDRENISGILKEALTD
ncbi:hypothetical protein AB7942_29135 [Neobacillus sp. BF23-41]|uniref:hypothetical protein n=1 Tax=Neobacillus sp. BF23-41 TaxID=3240280 RepID=UPI0034E44AB8